MMQVVLNLGADANLRTKTVLIRWHEGDDDGTSVSGWYVDSIVLSNAMIPTVCATGTGSVTASNNGPVCATGTLNLSASYSQDGGIYLWSGPNGFSSSLRNPSIPNATTAAPGTYTVTLTSAGSGVASNTTNATVIAAGQACSDGNACTSGETYQGGACAGGTVAPPPPATTGLLWSSKTLMSWTPSPGTAFYDVVRGVVSTLRSAKSFTPSVSACIANNVGGTTASDAAVPAAADANWYLVRGAGSCGNGTYNDGTQAGSRDAGINASANACP